MDAEYYKWRIRKSKDICILAISIGLLWASFASAQQRSAITHPDSLNLQLKQLTTSMLEYHARSQTFQALEKVQEGMFIERKHPSPTAELFDFNLYAGSIIAAMDYSYAMVFYKKATQIAGRNPGIHPSRLFTLYSNRAGLHGLLTEYDSAQYFYRKAIQISPMDSRDAEVSAYNNIGVFFFERMHYDSASHYFHKALDLMGHRRGAMGLYCAIRDNLAQLDVLEQNYTSALTTYTFNDSVYTIRKLHHKYLANKMRLIDVMKRLGKSGVIREIELGFAHLKAHGSEVPEKDAQAFLRLAIQEYNSQGLLADMQKVLAYSYHWTDSLQVMNADQLRFLNSSLLKVQEASFQNALQVKQLEADKAKIRWREARRLTWLSVSAGLIITTLLILYFRIRRQELLAQTLVAEAALKNKEIEGRLMQHELHLKQKDLTNLVLHNTQVHDANQKMIERLQAITRSKEDTGSQIRHLLTELQSQNNIGERAMTLQSEIEVLNAAFYENLRQRFPNLTKAEEELCGYLRIDLSTKDISILKNVEAASVKMAKNRLRKKLSLGPDADLYGFVKDI